MTLVRIEFNGYGSGYFVAELDRRWHWTVRPLESTVTEIAAHVCKYLRLEHGVPVDPLRPWIGAEAAARAAIAALGMGRITYSSDESRPPFVLDSEDKLRQRGRLRPTAVNEASVEVRVASTSRTISFSYDLANGQSGDCHHSDVGALSGLGSNSRASAICLM